MKIIISNYDEINNPYYGGGGAVAIHNIAKRLSKKHAVTIFSGKYPHYMSKQIDGVSYRHIGTKFGGPMLGQILYLLLLPFYAKTTNFDVWIESFTPPISTAFLPIFTKKPVIGLTHFLDSESKSKEYKVPFYLIERLGLKKYHYFIVLTEAVKNKVKKYNPHSFVSIIPNGIEVRHGSKKINREGKHILYLGRIEINQKGLDLLLDSYNQIKSRINLPLVVAGSGTQKDVDYLKNRVEELGLTNKIQLLGKVVGKEKEKLFNDAAIVVMPSRFETHPLVALEAMNYGCPLLVFNIEGFQWLPQTCVAKVKPLSTNSYAKMLHKLTNDPQLRKKMSTEAKKFIKMLDWDLLAQDYIKFIEKVILAERRKTENSHYPRLLSA